MGELEVLRGQNKDLFNEVRGLERRKGREPNLDAISSRDYETQMANRELGRLKSKLAIKNSKLEALKRNTAKIEQDVRGLKSDVKKMEHESVFSTQKLITFRNFLNEDLVQIEADLATEKNTVERIDTYMSDIENVTTQNIPSVG
jgi:DNA repair exonuclease SbcCD ATPase subunit